MRQEAYTVGLLAIILGGCVSVRRGDTLFHVETAALEDEKTIRRELWRIERAIEDVRLRYGLEGVTLEIDVTDLGGLGETAPALSGLADISGAKVHINSRLFLEEELIDHNLDDVLTGLIAHEFMHAWHYTHMSTADLIELGRRYQAMLDDPHGPQREWIRAYERLTDMMTIEFGYGEQLVHQKQASHANIAIHHPPAVWDFYLDGHEIRAMMADEAALRAEIAAALDILDLPSLDAARARPVFDSDGDFVRFEHP